MKPEAVVTPLQMGVPFGRRSPHVRGPYSMPNHNDCFFRRFGAPDAPDGVICGGEVIAMAVMAAAYDRKLLPQQDIRIITKQTSGLFDQVRPRIDTIYEDLSEAGRLMGQLLLQRIDGAKTGSKLQHLQTLSDF